MSNKSSRFKKLRYLLSTLKFNQNEFLWGLVIATLFSLFIYLEIFDLHFLLLNSIIAIYVFYKIFKATQGTLVVAGFFIGLFWFYWVGFSFMYVDMMLAIPFVSLVFGMVFSFTFWIIGFTQKIYFRLPLIFLLSFYDPFYFNWFRPELLLLHSYFGVTLWQYALFLSSIALYVHFQKQRFALLAFLLLLGSINFTVATTKPLPFTVTVEHTDIQQEQKWLRSQLEPILDMNFLKIHKAIKENKELVVLPESTIPLYLNLYPSLENQLKELSHKISIIIGSLYMHEQKPYNATYYFHNGEEDIAKKMILVPFGEYIPLPKFIRKYINDLIFQGGADYETAKTPTDFILNGIKIRNAICYEATCELFYKDGVRYITALTNNGWFRPSIEPVLQKLLIGLYAKRHGVTVLHSVNGSPSEIIHP